MIKLKSRKWMIAALGLAIVVAIAGATVAVSGGGDSPDERAIGTTTSSTTTVARNPATVDVTTTDPEPANVPTTSPPGANVARLEDRVRQLEKSLLSATTTGPPVTRSATDGGPPRTSAPTMTTTASTTTTTTTTTAASHPKPSCSVSASGSIEVGAEESGIAYHNGSAGTRPVYEVVVVEGGSESTVSRTQYDKAKSDGNVSAGTITSSTIEFRFKVRSAGTVVLNVYLGEHWAEGVASTCSKAYEARLS